MHVLHEAVYYELKYHIEITNIVTADKLVTCSFESMIRNTFKFTHADISFLCSWYHLEWPTQLPAWHLAIYSEFLHRSALVKPKSPSFISQTKTWNNLQHLLFFWDNSNPQIPVVTQNICIYLFVFWYRPCIMKIQNKQTQKRKKKEKKKRNIHKGPASVYIVLYVKNV